MLARRAIEMRPDDRVAVACIRGGGEYGAAWHRAAMGKNRYVGWDDLAWAAKYLQAKGISRPSSTAIYGISNGGTLVSACVNRHPELYGAVMADVGVIDLTRFHLFVSNVDAQLNPRS